MCSTALHPYRLTIQAIKDCVGIGGFDKIAVG